MTHRTIERMAGWSLLLLASRLTAAEPAVAGSPFTTLDLPYYTGQVFPQARQAVYADSFIPLTSVTIIPGAGMDAADPQIELLTAKLNQWAGAQAAVVAGVPPDRGTVIYLNAAGQGRPAPEKPEGYTLSCTQVDGRNVIAINGTDQLGRLWGMVSLLQLVRRENGTVAMRRAEITDWPEHPARGCLTNAFGDQSEPLMIFTKANTTVFQIRPPGGYAYWATFAAQGPQRIGPEIERLAPLFVGLGLNVYFSINPAAGDPKLSAGSERDFEMLVDWMGQVAALGAGVYWAYDDVRFPVPQADLDHFGSAAEADAYLVPKVFRAVRERYPDFRLVFCPPFYWGPSTPHPYPEDRETYLRRIGETFPPEIGIFWTGPRVQSSVITREETAWFTDLIGRKPWLFQNRGWLPHRYDRSYVTDRLTAWQDWRYEGFWNDMAVPLLNLHANQNMMSLASIADYLWNPAAYDAEQSVRSAVGAFYGPAAFPLLDAVREKLAYFNQYTRVTPAAVRNLPEITANWAAVMEAWERLQAEAPHPEAIRRFTVLASSIQLTDRFINRELKQAAEKGFAQFEEWEAAVKTQAIEEAGLTERDLLITPSLLSGGNGYMIYATRCEPRFAVWINGRQSPNPVMRSTFECRPFPPERDYQLILCGQEDATEEDLSCNIRIKVNDTVIHEGPSGFPRHGWARQTFTIPAAAMKHNNSLVFENLDDGVSRAPWFMLTYGIIRP